MRQNFIYQLGYQVVLLALSLLTLPYVSRRLGAAQVGSYSYTHAMAAYFSIAGSLGLNLYGQREIAYTRPGDRRGRSRILAECLILKTAVLLPLIVSYLFFAGAQGGMRMLCLIQLPDLVSSVLDITWFYQGTEEFLIGIGKNVGIRAAGTLLIFALVREPGDLYRYAAIQSAALLLGNMAMWLCLRGRICRVRLRELHCLRCLKGSAGLFLPQVSMQIYLLLDKTMLGRIADSPYESGCYEAAQQFIRLCLSGVTAMGTVAAPYMARHFAGKDGEAVRSGFHASLRFAGFVGFPSMFGLLALADELVPLLFGQGYEAAVPVLRIFSLLPPAVGFSNAVGIQYLLPTGRERRFTLSIAVGAAVNVVFNLLLIGRWGAAGAAVSYVLAESAVTLVQLSAVKREAELGRTGRALGESLFASAAMFFAVGGVSRLPLPGAAGIVLSAAAGGASYLGLICWMRRGQRKR